MSKIIRNGFVISGEPDKEKLAKLVNTAKGSERTMAEFAKEAGINPSMMSRFVNGNFTKPISIEILDAIVANSAEECSYGLEDFLEANGMTRVIDRNVQERTVARIRTMREQEEGMRRTITMALFERGVEFRKRGTDGKRKVSSFFKNQKDAGMSIIYRNRDKEIEWRMYMVPTMETSGRNSGSVEKMVQQWVEFYAIIFLQDAWEPEDLDGVRISFVFSDLKYFEQFIKVMKESRIGSYMTAILTDLVNASVLEERPLRDEWVDEICSPFMTPFEGSQESPFEDSYGVGLEHMGMLFGEEEMHEEKDS